MQPHASQTTILPPLSHAQPDLTVLMYRIDQNASETHRLRQEMQEGFGLIREDIQAIRKDQEAFRKELNDQRLEFKQALADNRLEFKQALADCRLEFKTELQNLRAESLAAMEAHRVAARQDFDAMIERTKGDMKELVASVVATVDDRIKASGQASDLRMLKWCAGSAAGSSAATGGLAYIVSKLMP
ncbi:hypothetical protein [Mitsuaria sp. GD03876]|uniref:hypothetical protein n=1 Tax=Mitsuaria sp. GD03876 TaxID=2975399 RepID=UPI002446EF99|nr:hypothetical protein [Mitsuaria sp. GD03876]MDH0866128.1 hypothetical protein [Mitsuaria sp. GD03876]